MNHASTNHIFMPFSLQFENKLLIIRYDGYVLEPTGAIETIDLDDNRLIKGMRPSRITIIVVIVIFAVLLAVVAITFIVSNFFLPFPHSLSFLQHCSLSPSLPQPFLFPSTFFMCDSTKQNKLKTITTNNHKEQKLPYLYRSFLFYHINFSLKAIAINKKHLSAVSAGDTPTINEDKPHLALKVFSICISILIFYHV